jgi:CMP/dCMP kinase
MTGVDGKKSVARSGRFVVAIDGPAGSGKSTVALLLSKRLGFALLDTGALYRGVALIAKEQGIDWDNERALAALTEALEFGFRSGGAEGAPRLMINDRDISQEIRRPDISLGASRVSKHPEVRARLLGLQRRLGERGGSVVEGRDIGTVVFPDAELKIFLVANPEVCGQRRYNELKQKGTEADLATVTREIQQRDVQDRQRAAAPLKPASDAIVVDTSDMSIDQVVDHIVELACGRGAFCSG